MIGEVILLSVFMLTYVGAVSMTGSVGLKSIVFDVSSVMPLVASTLECAGLSCPS